MKKYIKYIAVLLAAGCFITVGYMDGNMATGWNCGGMVFMITAIIQVIGEI